MERRHDGRREIDRCNKLSDEDVKAIATELERRLVNRFYLNLGKGLWGHIWRVVMFLAVSLAAYGAYKGYKL